MKKSYIATFIVLFSIILVIAFFHNQLINLALPLIKERISSQLQITDNENSIFNINANFNEKKIILRITNPVFKKNKYIKKGSAKTLIIEKEFKDLFNNNFEKLLINNFDLTINNQNIDFTNNQSIDKIILSQIENLKNFKNFSITDSIINLSEIAENHSIIVNEFNINNQTGTISSKGFIEYGNSKNIFTINNYDNEIINIKIDLDKYDVSFLKNYSSNRYLEVLKNLYSGTVKIFIKDDFRSYDILYDIFSANQKINISGGYNSLEDDHVSKINLLNIEANELLKYNNLFSYLNLVKNDKYNVEINLLNNFNNIEFMVNSTNNKTVVKGVMRKDSLVSLNIKGKELRVNDEILNNESRYNFLPFWTVSELIRKNNFSFEINYKKNQGTDFHLTDKFGNLIKGNYDIINKTLQSLKVNFFNSESNYLDFDGTKNQVKIKFDNQMQNFLLSNFDADIFKLNDNIEIDSFSNMELLLQLKKINYNEFEKIKKIEDFIKIFDISFKDIIFNKDTNKYINSGFLSFTGPIDFSYSKNNLTNNKSILIDLSKTKIDIDKIKYTKDVGIKQSVSFQYIESDEKIKILDKLSIDGNGVKIDGKVEIHNDFIKRIDFDNMLIGKNNFSGNLNLNLDEKNNLNNVDINIYGKKLDLSFLNVNETKSSLKNMLINVNIDVDNLDYINNTKFINTKLQGNFKNVWQKLNFKSFFASEGDIQITISPNKEMGRNVNILSSSAENTLLIKKISKSIRGGRLHFKGKYHSLENDNSFDADLVLKDFAIKKQSKISNFIKVIRIFDIQKQLAGDTEDFEYSSMKIKKRNKLYKITEGKTYGGLMALSLEGTLDKTDDSINLQGLVAPTHAIDSWVGNIPILGDILTGIEGGGVLAASYSVKGTVKEPKYFVNPLSILTPGIFKEFWKIFDLKKINNN
ncbi:MAG: hypothetical protein CFH20_00507 [Alphaproteobacteria bacterium MarineAlpha5_Bin10]|nr:MAG: hypothetical protein CFH20_00507 [Alphaproteobacteria bacterium MarineAlpha5_Bin10]|tara:strand:+ start:411 stop:3179 length:2769 start_codon:yes stop_codon:yes gene_type:complete